jgi:hypothetical protein
MKELTIKQVISIADYIRFFTGHTFLEANIQTDKKLSKYEALTMYQSAMSMIHECSTSKTYLSLMHALKHPEDLKFNFELGTPVVFLYDGKYKTGEVGTKNGVQGIYPYPHTSIPSIRDLFIVPENWSDVMTFAQADEKNLMVSNTHIITNI